MRDVATQRTTVMLEEAVAEAAAGTAAGGGAGGVRVSFALALAGPLPAKTWVAGSSALDALAAVLGGALLRLPRAGAPRPPQRPELEPAPLALTPPQSRPPPPSC